MKKILFLVLTLILSFAFISCGKTEEENGGNENPPAEKTAAEKAVEALTAQGAAVNPDYTYHAVGGFGAWDPTDDNQMTMTTIEAVKAFDASIGAKLEAAGAKFVAFKLIEMGTSGAGWDAKAMDGNTKKDYDGCYTVKVIKSAWDEDSEMHLKSQWIPDPRTAHTEALTNNIFIPTWTEAVDDNGFSWADNSVVTSGAGKYILIVADYGKASNENVFGYGYGLVKVGDVTLGEDVLPTTVVEGEGGNGGDLPEELATPLIYKEFDDLEVGEECVIEAYVAGFESFWDGKQTMYLADEDGNGYFVYEGKLTEDQAALIEVGVKVHVEGTKSEWSGEVEITDTTKFVVLSDEEPLEISPKDLTYELTTENFADYSNQYFRVVATFAGLNVEGTDYLFGYGWDNVGDYGKVDLICPLYIEGQLFNGFNLRRYMTGTGDDSIYKMLSEMGAEYIGQPVLIEAFMYIYSGKPQARITNIILPETTASFDAKEKGDLVLIDAYVMGFESYYNGKQTMFVATPKHDSFFLYEALVPESMKDSIVKGAHIVTVGEKTEWSGQVEIINTQYFNVLSDINDEISQVHITKALTNANAGTEFASLYFEINGTLIKSKVDPTDDDEYVYLLGFENTGSEGKCDLVFTVQTELDTFKFCIRRYMTPFDSEVYQQVLAWDENSINKTYKFVGFIYVYNGQCQARIIKITEK